MPEDPNSPIGYSAVPERTPNDARVEFMFDVLDGLPPARQKRLIIRARSPEVNFIDGVTAEVLLSALGLTAA